MAVSVFAPISIGNLSVGFDTLGLAVSPVDGALVGDIVHINAAKDTTGENSFVLCGSHADKLPQDKNNNIVWRCLLAFENALKSKAINPQTLEIRLEKNIPVSSGLGSSACSVVAAFVALNKFYDEPFSQSELLEMMGELEAQISGSLHYDNVAPCYLGGLQLMLNDPDKISQRLPGFNDCYWVIAYPDIEVSTKAAREILPAQYDRQILIEFGQNLAGFVDACYRKDKTQAFSLIKDVVAEPYRARLLPNFEQVKTSVLQSGALAFGISGSGPTVFCACDDKAIADQCAEWLKQNYLQTENGFVYVCRADETGARTINQ